MPFTKEQQLIIDGVRNTSSNSPIELQSQGNFSDMFSQAAGNAIPSAVQYGKDLVQPFAHPIDTVKSLATLGNSVLGKAGITDADPATANAVGEYFAKRYGGKDELMRTFAKDPVGLIGDLSTVLTGGSGLLKVPSALAKSKNIASALGKFAAPTQKITEKIANAGSVLSKAGNVIDPVNLALKGGTAIRRTASIPLAISSGTGLAAAESAYKAGREGGFGNFLNSNKLKNLQEQMRDPSTYQNVIDEAKTALETMKKDKSAQYVKDIDKVNLDPAIVDLSPIRESIDNIKNLGVYKGKSKTGPAILINSPAVKSWNIVDKILNKWESLDPTEYHTVEGLDSLKKQLRNEAQGLAFDSPERIVFDQAYNAVRGQIIKQAPAYAKVMKNYEEASDTINEIQKTFSLKKGVVPDTQLRKLQSIMRNDAQANYGARADLAKVLEEKGAPNLTSMLAGQMYSSPLPRGMSGQVSGATLGLAALQSLDPKLLLGYAATSPRVVGETNLLAGKLASTPTQIAKLLETSGNEISRKYPELKSTIDFAKTHGGKIDPRNPKARMLAVQLSRYAQLPQDQEQ